MWKCTEEVERREGGEGGERKGMGEGDRHRKTENESAEKDTVRVERAETEQQRETKEEGRKTSTNFHLPGQSGDSSGYTNKEAVSF